MKSLISVQVKYLPFHAAHLQVRGDSPETSFALARVTCQKLAKHLKGAVIWPPTPKGFNQVEMVYWTSVEIELREEDSEADQVLLALENVT